MRGLAGCSAKITRATRLRPSSRTLCAVKQSATYAGFTSLAPVAHASRVPDNLCRSQGRLGQSSSLGYSRSNSTLVKSDAQRSTIYALSTPPGKAGVAVIRISGPEALQVWRSMVAQPLSQRKRSAEPEPWKMYRSNVVHPRTGELLDSGLAVYFKGPRSFTGEDVVELHVHSGRAIISSILEALACESYCRLAEPGEFTRRAFHRGRLDLTEVEGLHDLINAETSSQRQAALQAVGGKLRIRFEAIRKDILRSLSLVEALIDFGEEDVEENVYEEAKVLAEKAITNIEGLLADYKRGEILRSGVKLAIFGPPNAGKSTLLNLLAQRDAAIVTNIPGTTRDVLEVSLDLGGLPVIVADTAGIRQTNDVVEKIGVERATDAVANADVTLCVLSLADVVKAGANALERELALMVSADKTYLLLNKSDLLPELGTANTQRIAEQVRRSLDISKSWIVSLDTNEGTDVFLSELGSVLRQRYNSTDASSTRPAPLVINSRHRAHLESALRFLKAFLSSADSSDDIVCAAEELRYAANAVGKITGHIGVEDVLDTIFREFCIGK